MTESKKQKAKSGKRGRFAEVQKRSHTETWCAAASFGYALVMRLRGISLFLSVFVLGALVARCSDDDGASGADQGAGPDAATSADAAARLDGTVPPDQALAADAAAPDQARTAPDASKPYKHEDISVTKAWQLIQTKKYTLLDVREPSELTNDGHIAGAVNLPWNSGKLKTDHATLPKGKGVIVYCRSGFRSGLSAPFLTGKGFKPVYNVLGGFLAWKSANLPYKK